MHTRFRLLLPALALVLAGAVTSQAQPEADQRSRHVPFAGAVYTMTNAPAGNAVLVLC